MTLANSAGSHQWFCCLELSVKNKFCGLWAPVGTFSVHRTDKVYYQFCALLNMVLYV